MDSSTEMISIDTFWPTILSIHSNLSIIVAHSFFTHEFEEKEIPRNGLV